MQLTTRKVLIAAVVAFVVLPAAAALLVPILLTPAMLKAAVEQQASQRLGRPVTVGSARAQLFPRVGVALTQVALSGPQRLTADEVVVGTSLRGLLSRRIEGAVVRVRNGRLTLPEAATLATPAEPARPPVPTPGAARPAAQPRTPVTAAPTSQPAGLIIGSVAELIFDNVVVIGGGKQLRLDLDGSLIGDTFDVARVSMSSGATSLQGSGTLSSISRRDGNFSFTSPLVDVDEVLAVLAALMPADPSATGMSALSGEEPAGVTFGHVTVRVTVDRGQALGYQVSKLEGAIELKGTRLTARPLAFDLYGGRYESTLDADLATNYITLAHNATLTGASVGQLSERFDSAGAATGAMNLTMQLRGAGRDLRTAAGHMSGGATVRISDGTIAGLDVVRQAFSALGSTPLEGTQGERFEWITATIGVASGVLSTDNFVLHSPDFDLNGRVRIDPGGRLSGSADLMLSEALSSDAQARNRDLKLAFEGGRVTLPVNLAGTLTNPRVLPDISNALRRAARNRGAEELRRGLNRLLKH